MKTKFYFVRHGKSEASVKEIVQGVGLNIPLVEEGRKQAESLARNLSQTRFDVIFASTAIRSAETADIIKKFHPETPVIKIYELNERSKGAAEGMLKKDFNLKYPDILEQWGKEMDVRVAGGENYEDVEKRAIPIISGHLELYKGKSLLYVTHGNVIKVLLGYMLEAPYGKRARIKQDYCAVNAATYDHDKERWEIESVNKIYGEFK